MNDKIINATVAELRQGYSYDESNKKYCCLFCEQQYTQGEIYTSVERLTDAQTAVSLHITEAHGSPFTALIAEDKKYTGLTDVQRELMIHFYNGTNDKQIAHMTDTSPSTVRFQRYNLREKAKQAKIFLALYEQMWERLNDKSIPQIHNGAQQVDERYMVTDAEEEKIVNSCFASLDPPVLLHFPPKEKKKLVILRIILRQFEPGRKYTEKQVNEILQPIYEDFISIRRYFIEYGFMGRTIDGREYWLK